MSVLWQNLGLERWVVAGSCRILYVRLDVAGEGIESALGKGSSFVSVSLLTLLCLCSHLCLPLGPLHSVPISPTSRGGQHWAESLQVLCAVPEKSRG